VTVTVSEVNDPPTAAADSKTATEDTPLSFPTSDLAANDAEGPPNEAAQNLTVVSVQSPTNGTVSLTDGTITFTPAANFNGAASFAYTVRDNGTSNGAADAKEASGAVSITVNAVNDAPVASGNGYTTAEETPLTVAAPGVLGNDSDVDSSSLTAIKVSDPTNGTVTLNANGSFAYTPAPGFSGLDSFTYRASDGALDSNVATVTIDVGAVNDAPVAVSDSYNVTEDTSLTIPAPGVLGNDTDSDSASLTAAKVSNPANGAVTVNTNGSFTYTPNGNFHGTDSFTYKTSDGALDSNIATVTLTVAAVNDAPVAGNDSATTAEDSPVDVDVLANDTDAEGDILAVADVTDPMRGTVAIVDGKPRYVPDTDFHGTDTFSYTVSDGRGGSATATVTLTVNNVAPSATFNAPTSVNEGSAINVSLANVVDPGAADTHEYRFSCDDGATWTDWDPTASHACPTTDNGTRSVKGQLRDDDGGMSGEYSAPVTVNNVTPRATVNASTSVNEGSEINVALSAPSDPSSVDTAAGFQYRFSCDNGTTWTAWSATASHACATNDNGTSSVTGEIRDKDDGTSAYSASIGVTNVAPSADFNAPASVSEGSDIEISLSNVVDPGSADTHEFRFSCDNGTTWTPYGNGASHACPTSGVGTKNVKGEVRDDDGGTSTYAASVTVSGVNHAPAAANDATSTPEDTPVSIAVLANDTDVDGDTLTIGSFTQPASGAVTAAANELRYAPAPNFHGSDSFTYTIGDGSGRTATATVTITVTPVNDAPIALSDAFSVEHNGTLTVSTPGVLGNDTDVESGLGAAAVANPSSGTLSLNPNGSFTYVPNAGFGGTDSFTYKANDGALDSNVATVTITVAQAPAPPPPPPAPPPAADVQAPTDPVVQSTSHTVGTPSPDRTIDLTWSGATDNESGVDGFSFLWDNQPTSVPDTVKDAEETATGTTSPALSNGAWYFHLRTRDNAGNWTATRHVGPFVIAVRTTQQARCVVPNLKGKTLAQARKLLAAGRCALGKVTRARSRLARAGRIVRQSRKPGARLPRGTKVNVVVSLGARR
jgi:VCBS repeat-containing protein